MIYLDNAATTEVDQRVLKAMLPYFSRRYGNASSLHWFGRESRLAVDWSAEILADFFGCQKSEIFFTSGATESDNWALQGIVGGLIKKKRSLKKIHLITSKIEHKAILAPIRELERQGLLVSYLPVDSRGVVRPADLAKEIGPNTALVSIMYVNNEIGTIQPIARLSRVIKAANRRRSQKIYFHSDAAQALNYCDCRVERLGVDLLSFSGHKIYGPKGIGGLYVRTGVPLAPLIQGGGQQSGYRGGTYDTPSIVGLGRAVELLSLKTTIRANRRITGLRDYFLKEIKKKITGFKTVGDSRKKVPGNAFLLIDRVEGESLVLFLSDQGIAVSSGSACASGSLKPSHVLTALGIKPERSHGSLRITLSRTTTKKEIDVLVKELAAAVKKMRKISPF